MDVKYQVFVSSTYVDLVAERRSVIESILNLGHIPVGMEVFQASDDTQWDYIKRRIDESDYYVVIVAERYGSEQRGKSYTQMEYEYAVKIGIPVAAFLLESATRKTLPAERVEFDKLEKINKFRTLCQKKLVKYWRNSDDLGGKVAMALHELMRDAPRIGWVRADSMPSTKVLEELTRLSDERRQLQNEVERLSVDTGILRIPAEAQWLIDDLAGKTVGKYIEARGLASDNPKSLLQFFWDILTALTHGVEVWEASRQFSGFLRPEGSGTSTVAFKDAVTDVMNELLLANLVITITKESYMFDEPNFTDYYRLSDYGKQFTMFAKEVQSRSIQAVLNAADLPS